LSPATVLASAKAAKAALDRVATTEATLNYLAEDAYATGYGIVTSRDYALASAADNARLAFAKEDEGGAAAADRFSLALKSGNGEPLEPWTRAPDDSSLMDTMSQDQVERVNQILAECDKHHGTYYISALLLRNRELDHAIMQFATSIPSFVVSRACRSLFISQKYEFLICFCSF